MIHARKQCSLLKIYFCSGTERGERLQRLGSKIDIAGIGNREEAKKQHLKGWDAIEKHKFFSKHSTLERSGKKGVYFFYLFVLFHESRRTFLLPVSFRIGQKVANGHFLIFRELLARGFITVSS